MDEYAGAAVCTALDGAKVPHGSRCKCASCFDTRARSEKERARRLTGQASSSRGALVCTALDGAKVPRGSRCKCASCFNIRARSEKERARCLTRQVSTSRGALVCSALDRAYYFPCRSKKREGIRDGDGHQRRIVRVDTIGRRSVASRTRVRLSLSRV